MITALSVQRDHLRQHRRMIIGRSILASVVSAVPVPVLDDQLSYLVQRSILRKIAEEYQIDLDDDAYKSIVFGESEPANLFRMAGGTLAYKLVSRYRRSLLFPYLTVKRAQAASRYFSRATLFDHYCAKLHVGLGLDGESALELRKVIDQALDATPGSLGTRLFRRGLLAATRASVRAPVEVAQMISGRVMERLLKRSEEEEELVPIEELDLALDQQLRAQSGFLARLITAIELQMSVEGNPYLDELVDTFERLWRLPGGLGKPADEPADEPADGPEPSR